MWKSNPKAWVTQTIFQDCFFHHFIPEEDNYCLEKDIEYFAAWWPSGPPSIHAWPSSNYPQILCRSSNLSNREL